MITINNVTAVDRMVELVKRSNAHCVLNALVRLSPITLNLRNLQYILIHIVQWNLMYNTFSPTRTANENKNPKLDRRKKGGTENCHCANAQICNREK